MEYKYIVSVVLILFFGLCVYAQHKSVGVLDMTNSKDIGLQIYKTALKKGVTKADIYVVVDFSLPSNEPRFTIYDSSGQPIYKTFVAHGEGSGGVDATKFSNIDGSHMSSLGVYKTLQTYQGKHGYSLRIDGLEDGFNNHAFVRNIVVHGSDYIGNGRTGRSWGCFAIPQSEVRRVINQIKGGVLIIAYYPDQKWLSESKFLN